MTDLAYQQLKRKFHDVFYLEPNDFHIGVLNNLFRISTGSLKSFPFKIIIPVSFAGAIVIYLALGYLITRLVTILQYGF